MWLWVIRFLLQELPLLFYTGKCNFFNEWFFFFFFGWWWCWCKEVGGDCVFSNLGEMVSILTCRTLNTTLWLLFLHYSISKSCFSFFLMFFSPRKNCPSMATTLKSYTLLRLRPIYQDSFAFLFLMAILEQS